MPDPRPHHPWACSCPTEQGPSPDSRRHRVLVETRHWQRATGTEVGPQGASAIGRSGEAGGCMSQSRKDELPGPPSVSPAPGPASGPPEAGEVAWALMWAPHGRRWQAPGDSAGQSSP